MILFDLISQCHDLYLLERWRKFNVSEMKCLVVKLGRNVVRLQREKGPFDVRLNLGDDGLIGPLDKAHLFKQVPFLLLRFFPFSKQSRSRFAPADTLFNLFNCGLKIVSKTSILQVPGAPEQSLIEIHENGDCLCVLSEHSVTVGDLRESHNKVRNAFRRCEIVMWKRKNLPVLPDSLTVLPQLEETPAES